MQFKRIKKNINGILLLDKPIGYSSNKALQKAKHLFQAAKAGHTGTLDPMATGVLPICFGEATKFSQFLTDADKVYEATLKLGETTTTGDAEGTVLAQLPVDCTQESFEAACMRFVGEIQQTPPMYSALKHNGKPLYEYARAGIEIDRPARPVTISKIVLNSFQGEVASISVWCSKGTYIRTLAEDIGKTLGCGSHLIGLRRLLTANFPIDNTITLDDLSTLTEYARLQLLLGVDAGIPAYPSVKLSVEQANKIQLGQIIKLSHQCDEAYIKLYDSEDKFLGLGIPKGPDAIAPKRLAVM